jgi:hypothetical protein
MDGKFSDGKVHRKQWGMRHRNGNPLFLHSGGKIKILQIAKYYSVMQAVAGGISKVTLKYRFILAKQPPQYFSKLLQAG